MAKGLIPLMLSSPDSISSVIPKSPTRASYSPPVSPAHRRNQSDVTPIIKLSRPPVRSSMKRQSQQIPASLPQIPYSSTEWKRAINEIKRYHVTRRYRACSARCNEILTNIKTLSSVEPAYLIYLNFYAAASLEMCARSLAPASAYRISLLQQARSHYEKAASLIRAAEDTAILRSRSNSVASSLPSLHSPSGSVSSRAWTPEIGVTTPTCCLSRKSSLANHTRPTKKKVSFELPRDKSRWSFTLPEPVIRPDSPTLGFDDDYFTAGTMRQELPEIPTGKRSSPPQELEIISPAPPFMPSISERDELSPIDGTESPSTDDSHGGEYPFFQPGDVESARSLGRYCETLSALKVQVSSHLAALDEVLEKDMQNRPESPILHDGGALMAASLNRVSLHSGRQSRAESVSGPRGSSAMGFAEGEESDEKARERKARIDRLKMSGWRRKRFDASRYEVLCEVVMTELNHG
ncbi:hypothetical protein N0V93_003583 [Gnomoniopsis smithogilvyi]|uniref:Uncharacterized protein n=1 Tax=Gnomoniopsis smithogilvyi TaxID=1191159 RepID=A0A9W8YZ02_9PEZI|nr:hypothetical protein N0V93_003583 [Gnomoniopsis smithogilvyi]